MKTGVTYQLRSDLEFSSQQQIGKNYVVVKDPITSRYFRFTETQGALVELLREPGDVPTLGARVSEKLGATIPEATLEGFLNSLEEKLLLDTEQVRDKMANYKGQKLQNKSVLYRKLASFNPERIFAWLEPRTRWAFTPWFQVFAILVILSGVTISILHRQELALNVVDLFNLHGLFLIWLVTMTVVTLHEFAHGMTCVHFGGKVQEVGFMLIYFQPAFYCDVSDSWMLPQKRQRMLVTLAGGYFQLVIWGICTILWRITDADTTINQLATVVIVFAGLQTLFNFNPLIKLDGYYMLSDYLEIPNLRDKAMHTLWNRVAGKRDSKLPRRQERAQLTYGLASMAFSTTLLIYVYAALYTWATDAFAFAGLVGFVMFSTMTLRKTAVESMAGLRSVWSRAAYRKYRNGGIVLAAIVVSFVAHWELKIKSDFKVIARDERTVRPETGGVIVEVLVQEGTRVAKGDVIARLRDYDKQQKISELSGDLERRNSDLALLRSGTRPEEIDRQRRLIESKRVAVSNARRNAEQRGQAEQNLARKQAQLKQDQQTLQRDEQLFREQLIPKIQLEKSQTAVTISERDVAEAQASIRVISETADREADLKSKELAVAESELRMMLAGSRPEQIRQAEAEVQKLEQQVSILNQELARTDVRAPIDGVVTTPFIERRLNQMLKPGDELLRLVDIGRVTIEMQVPEKEMADVKQGSRVTMAPRIFPGLFLEGRVDFISPVAQTVSGQQMVTVRSELPNEDLTLKPDMTGVGWIYCGKRRIFDLMTRRMVRWVKTEFWYLLP